MLSTSSLSDTYFLASRAKSKLTREASRHDHDLRVLVSHANLLDSLMDSIHEKKKEQYKQRQLQLQQQRVMNYNNHSGSISFDLANTKRTTYNSPILEQNDDDDYMDSDSDSDSDSDDEADDEPLYTYHYNQSYRTMPTVDEEDDEEKEQEPIVQVVESSDEEHTNAPPSLSYSSDEEEDDELPSPTRDQIITVHRLPAKEIIVPQQLMAY